MANSLPVPYPDELLYSIIARYHLRSGNTSPKATIEDLFSSRTATAIVDMPCNIDVLCENISKINKIEPENLILYHTLFPYYTAFLRQDRVEFAMAAMRSDFGGNIHSSMGIMASTISVPEFLRFCPECNRVDASIYGEYYWHRIHQMPGVFVCPEHFELLHNSTIAVHGMNKHEFFVANKYNCLLNQVLEGNQNQKDKLYDLAKDIVWLTENYEVIRNSKGLQNGFRDKYIGILVEKGYATSSGRVYQKEFIDAFRRFYGDDFLSVLQCDFTDDFESNWLSSIVRKHRKAFHPLRHLMLIRFLTGGVVEFFKQNYKYKPFGNGPWPCLNADADHFKAFVVDDLKVTHSSDVKKPIGTFACSCGFVYSRSGPDKTDVDIFKIGRIKQFGLVWEDRLRELVEKDKLGLREISRRLNVDTNTVKRYAGLLKLQVAWCTYKNTSENSQNAQINSFSINLKESYRETWQNLKYEHPEASKSELRKLGKATYIWLYRNDRDWLSENSPAESSYVYKNTRVDWHLRDNEVLEKAKKAVKEISVSHSKPERITIGRIGKMIGMSSLLEKHMDKMPKTQEYLKKAVESSEQYAIRRISWCAGELRKNSEEIMEWKLIRMAGIRKGYSEEVRKALLRESKQ